jgi:hypothetical protein
VSGSIQNLVCPQCGASNDPQYRFCLKCGSKLPDTALIPATPTSEASGLARGIEPPSAELHAEPSYTGGTPLEKPDDSATPEGRLPEYAPTIKKPEGHEKIEATPRGCLVGFLILLGIAIPPLGAVTATLWAFNKRYRQAALPGFLAALLGASLWGWGIFAEMKQSAYDSPNAILKAYISAEDWAMESRGSYLPLVELKMKGYLPPDFPRESALEFSIVEHVMGPTGYVIEIRPGVEENAFYRLKSMWADQTGVIRLGGRDGPLFQH